MQTTLGCWSDAAACASRRNLTRRSSCRAIDSFITLIATVRSSTESRALYTTPIAPSPTSSRMQYLPMSGICVSAIWQPYAADRSRSAGTRIFSGEGNRAIKKGRAVLLPVSCGHLDRRWHLRDRLDHGLARLQQHRLQIEIALNATHHVVTDHGIRRRASRRSRLSRAKERR